MKRLFLLFSSLLILVSCQDESDEKMIESDNFVRTDQKSNLDYKKDFSKALALVLSENRDVRSLIKEEALKQINFEYDVLYELIKDVPLENGSSFRSELLKFISEENLSIIEDAIPNLTIFVPPLDEDFRAEIWNVDSEIPSVGIREKGLGYVPAYNEKGEEYIIESKYIPAYPIVVVKENERIVSETSLRSDIEKSNISRLSASKSNLVFIDKSFDNTKKQSLIRNDFILYNIGKLYDAYLHFPNASGWQRDHVYYNMTPTDTIGAFDNTYKEYLFAFEMNGDAVGAYNKISDAPEDPEENSDGISWTDGEFEFKVKVYVGNKAGFGTELITYFRALPQELFTHTYIYVVINGMRFKTYQGMGLSLGPKDCIIPLFDWNLDTYSYAIKIAIEEVDNPSTTVNTTSTSSEFASNFGLSVEAGISKWAKLGLQFGATQKTTETVTHQITTSQGNDELGEVIITFSDPIVDRRPPQNGAIQFPLLNKSYYTGWYRLYVSPLNINDTYP